MSLGPRTWLSDWLRIVELLLELDIFSEPERAFRFCRHCLCCGLTFMAGEFSGLLTGQPGLVKIAALAPLAYALGLGWNLLS